MRNFSSFINDANNRSTLTKAVAAVSVTAMNIPSQISQTGDESTASGDSQTVSTTLVKTSESILTASGLTGPVAAMAVAASEIARSPFCAIDDDDDNDNEESNKSKQQVEVSTTTAAPVVISTAVRTDEETTMCSSGVFAPITAAAAGLKRNASTQSRNTAPTAASKRSGGVRGNNNKLMNFDFKFLKESNHHDSVTGRTSNTNNNNNNNNATSGVNSRIIRPNDVVARKLAAHGSSSTTNSILATVTFMPNSRTKFSSCLAINRNGSMRSVKSLRGADNESTYVCLFVVFYFFSN